MQMPKETLIASFVIFLFLIIITIAFYLFIANESIQIDEGQTVFITPVESRLLTPSFDSQETSTETEILPGVIGIGYPVVIANTGGDGLRIRNAPGLDSLPLFLGREGEEYIIIDGPSLKDSIIWWMVESRADSNRNGWAAQDYLQILD
jgi:hypothetical protein